MGRTDVIVTCNTSRQIGESGLMFDVIVVDAPCSGEVCSVRVPAVADWSLATVDIAPPVSV